MDDAQVRNELKVEEDKYSDLIKRVRDLMLQLSDARGECLDQLQKVNLMQTTYLLNVNKKLATANADLKKQIDLGKMPSIPVADEKEIST